MAAGRINSDWPLPGNEETAHRYSRFAPARVETDPSSRSRKVERDIHIILLLGGFLLFEKSFHDDRVFLHLSEEFSFPPPAFFIASTDDWLVVLAASKRNFSISKLSFFYYYLKLHLSKFLSFSCRTRNKSVISSNKIFV